MNIFKINILVLLIYLQSQLFGADINQTIVSGDVEFYSKLEKSLNREQPKDILELQLTLLKKLKAISSADIKGNISKSNLKVPTSEDEYRDSFERYIDLIFDRDRYSSQISKDRIHISSLKREIEAEENFDLTKQLFYAFYIKNIELLNYKIEAIDRYMSLYKRNLTSAVPDIIFNIEKSRRVSKSYMERLKRIRDREVEVKLEIEQSQLVDNNRSVDILKGEMERLKSQESNLILKRLTYQFLIFSKLLQDKDEKLFEYEDNIYRFIESYYTDRYETIEGSLSQLLKYMKREILGIIKTVEGESVEDLKEQILTLWRFINRPIFHINNRAISIFKLIVAIVILILGLFISKLYKHYIRKLASRSRNITESTETLLINLGHYFIFIMTIFIVLNVLGIDLSSIALVAGALSVGIGFGLQNIISNFVSGIILMVERSIKIGDYIEVDKDTRGRVTDIRMRSIVLNTGSNIDITVPNQRLVENRVINWSMNDKIRKFEIPFSVAYGTSPDEVIKIVLDAVESFDGCSSLIKSGKRSSKVVMTNMGESSIDFELFIWIEGESIFASKSVTSKFLILIYETLNRRGIEIPFPQQDVNIRSFKMVSEID